MRKSFSIAQLEMIRAELHQIDMEAYIIEMIDDGNDMVNCCGMQYLPSRVIQEVDPIAFRCRVADGFDAETMTELDNEEYYWTSEIEALDFDSLPC